MKTADPIQRTAKALKVPPEKAKAILAKALKHVKRRKG